MVRKPPTDEEQIRTLFDKAALAIEKKQIGDAVLGVSERFQGNGLDKRGVKQLLTYQVLRGSWVWVTIARTTVELHGNTAQAIVDVVMSRSGKGIPLKKLLPERATVYRIDFQLVREESDWKVIAAQWAPISLQEALDDALDGKPIDSIGRIRAK